VTRPAPAGSPTARDACPAAVNASPSGAGRRVRPPARVALVHDWLTGMRGGERCLEVVCELFPEAPLYTLLHVPGSVSAIIENRRIVTTFVNRLPAVASAYRHYLPLFPAAARQLDLRGFDLVISLSHCVAKSVTPAPGALHLCYCFTPMRYIWDRYEDYVGPRAGMLARLGMPVLRAALRRWDRGTRGVDRFIAISTHVADRIRRAYGREADVLHPPVDVQRFRISDTVDDFYLVVSALAPYKRVDLALEATRRLGRRLLVVGTGPDERRLRRMASPSVEFLGWRPDVEVATLYSRCRAVLFTAVEDFGIVPLEAAAAGRPTIALARGGALETMVGLDRSEEAPTAVFFDAQTADALAEAIRRFEAAAHRFDAKALRARAERFDRSIFKDRLREYVDRRWREHAGC
jgi:glycosyltransferase involved in cell wall biosynthesis